jgi:hypothetical protein
MTSILGQSYLTKLAAAPLASLAPVYDAVVRRGMGIQDNHAAAMQNSVFPGTAPDLPGGHEAWSDWDRRNPVVGNVMATGLSAISRDPQQKQRIINSRNPVNMSPLTQPIPPQPAAPKQTPSFKSLNR